MKFNITAGSHKATVDLETDGKGHFTVSFSSEEYGDGTGSGVITGDHYIGVVSLRGHKPNLEATIIGGAIKGTLKLWPWPALHFEGTEIK